MDDEDVLYRSGTRKEVVPLRKFSGNPVIAPDRPWEGMIGWVSVGRAPGSGKFQMWYQAYNEKRNEKRRAARKAAKEKASEPTDGYAAMRMRKLKRC